VLAGAVVFEFVPTGVVAVATRFVPCATWIG